MNVLITGATSFVGAETARAFLGAGHHVFAPVRPSSRRLSFLPEHENLVRLEADMGDIAKISGMGLPEMETVVHFAWEGVGVKGRMDPEIQEKNVRNTLELLKVSRQLGCRAFLFAGSQAEYGITLERVRESLFSGDPVTEEERCCPVSEYGKGKLRVLKEGSELAEQLGVRYCHMRIFSVYGNGDHETSLISSCVRAAKEGQTAELGPCRQQWNFLHIKDCGRAVLALTELAVSAASAPELREQAASNAGRSAEETGTGRGKSVFNIGGDDTRLLRDFVQEVFDIAPSCGYDGAGFHLAERPVGPEGTPYLSPDISKIREMTGWSPRICFRDGIREMLLQ